MCMCKDTILLNFIFEVGTIYALLTQLCDILHA